MGLSPYELERNDVDGALQCYNEAVAEGAPDDELDGLVRTLMRLQDDPSALLAKLPERHPHKVKAENMQALVRKRGARR